MVNLTGLDISEMGRHLTSLLVDVPFPRLVELKIPQSSKLMPFLHTHGKNLKVIIIQTGIPDSETGDNNNNNNNPSSSSKPSIGTTFQQIETPELMTYIGPCDIIPYVLPGSQVQFLTVSWDPRLKRSELEKIMQSLKMSKKGITGMDNLVAGWNHSHLLEIIAENVPSIEMLGVKIVCPAMNKETIDVRHFLFSTCI